MLQKTCYGLDLKINIYPGDLMNQCVFIIQVVKMDYVTTEK